MAIISGGKIIEGSVPRPGQASDSTVGSLGPFESPGVPASGFLNGTARKGAIVIDTTNGKQYTNTGTLAATVYTVTGAQV